MISEKKTMLVHWHLWTKLFIILSNVEIPRWQSKVLWVGITERIRNGLQSSLKSQKLLQTEYFLG